MKSNLEKTTVRDIARLINTSCLTADASTSLEKLAQMLCTSDRYKVYLNDLEGHLCGVIQAKQIAMELLRLSKNEEDAEEMLPAQAFMLNSRQGGELAEDAPAVFLTTKLGAVLNMMEQNNIREIAVVDEDEKLIGTLEAKHILSYYLQNKAAAL
ncbi:CBS domain-containing protein [Tichowtungia aerotolerans]|uniref:CBS domain-containing protein n=1 Tax=Tichowtungia aerotolerans TaxID=2697043 RepID=A0A6P1M7I9_9BACT|nr:CBS domain-containing protein [Tichowtungia aerotolerans]QHI68138.1 CBS domain-containing protein [Tichowtungia aerotolerans]